MGSNGHQILLVVKGKVRRVYRRFIDDFILLFQAIEIIANKWKVGGTSLPGQDCVTRDTV